MTPDYVLVEHRASFKARTIILLAVGYAAYCLLPPVRKPLVELRATRDMVYAAVALLMLVIPWIGGATWLWFASGEVMHCDRAELRFARRRTLGRWRRYRFPLAEVRGLHYEIWGGPKRRTYPVLRCQIAGKNFLMLEEIERDEAERILMACRAWGVDVVSVSESDPGLQMLKHIETRGWWVNPLKPEPQQGDRDPTEG